jgi:hypothetical protein
MKNVIIAHHLGLGDIIVCNGIVNEYSKRYDNVIIFSKHNCSYSGSKNITSIRGMYSDNPRVTVIPVNDDYDMFNYIKTNTNNFTDVKVIGFTQLNPNAGINFEKQFYAHAEINFNKKWESFHIGRNLNKEKNIKNAIIVDDASYVFVHDDISRNMIIDTSFLQGKLVKRPDKIYSDNIFDFCTLIELAEEIHVIDSCFMFLIDALPYINNKQKLFIHRYSRSNDDWLLPELRKEWVIIAEPKRS